VSHLTKRIEILVKEIDKLTDIVNNNVVEQAELTEKYNDLLKAYQQQELQLKTSEEKLATHFRNIST
jgi:predicted  nucleic acid-binding Zn-ribbon protein